MKLFGSVKKKVKEIKETVELRPIGPVRRGLILYAYIPLSVAYLEILLRLLCGYSFLPGLLFALFCSFSVGLVISGISLLFLNHKVSRVISGVLLGILCLAFAFEYFMYNTYKVFMNFDTIVLGAGGVVTGFQNAIISAIVSGIPAIIGYFLPFILFLFLTRKGAPYMPGNKKARTGHLLALGILLVISIAGQLIFLYGSSANKAAYRAEYNFDSSSQRLGILTGLGLELKHGIFGSPYEAPSFVTEEPFHYEPPAEQPNITTAPESPVSIQPSAAPVSGSPEPISSGEPVQETPPIEVEYGYNVIDIDFAGLIAGERDSRIKALHEYVSSLSGSKQNKYTGLF